MVNKIKIYLRLYNGEFVFPTGKGIALSCTIEALSSKDHWAQLRLRSFLPLTVVVDGQ